MTRRRRNELLALLVAWAIAGAILIRIGAVCAFLVATVTLAGWFAREILTDTSEA